MDLSLFIQKVCRKEILPLTTSTETPLNADLNKEDLGNLIKGSRRIFLFPVPDRRCGIGEADWRIRLL